MATVIALVFLAICLVNIGRAVVAPGVINGFIAVLSLFSIGYNALPILFIELTPMRNLEPGIVASVTWMALLFYLCVIVGLELMRARVTSIRPFTLPLLDRFVTRNWWPITAAAAAIYLLYITTVQLTSYSAEDFNAFFDERTPFAGAIAFFATFALAMIAVNLAAAVQARRSVRIAAALAFFIVIELILVGKGQRLVFIAPLFTVLAAMLARRQFRAAAIGTLVGIGALVLVSPFAVMLREARANDRSLTASNVDYDLGRSPLQTLLQSILDRGDGLETATVLKDHFDRRGSDMTPLYFASVLASPVPRAFFADKPTAASTNGKPNGEISVLAWEIRHGNSRGSLTAFGYITAYREGGWPMVIVNGVATGLMFGFLFLTSARGGPIGQAFFAICFVNWCVQKVPPSFWEAMTDVMTYLPIVLALVLLNFVLTRLQGDTPSVRTPRLTA